MGPFLAQLFTNRIPAVEDIVTFELAIDNALSKSCSLQLQSNGCPFLSW